MGEVVGSVVFDPIFAWLVEAKEQGTVHYSAERAVYCLYLGFLLALPNWGKKNGGNLGKQVRCGGRSAIRSHSCSGPFRAI